MKNLTQDTYNHLVHKLRNQSDRFPRSITAQDAKDLLLAYESAVQLLDAVMSKGACCFPLALRRQWKRGRWGKASITVPTLAFPYRSIAR